MLTHHAPIRIRPYKEADLATLEHIHDLARPLELKGSCDLRAFVPLAQDTDDYPRFLKAQKWVALVNKRPVGFVGMDPGEISWLYVHPHFSGRGIGMALLQHALSRLGPDARCYVLAQNTRALKLYTRAGFQEVCRFEGDNKGYPCTVLELTWQRR